MTDNMEEFNEWTAKILDHLYSEFPKAVDFEFSVFTGTKDKHQNEIFDGTMQFLKNEGYILFGHVGSFEGDSYCGSVLTAKGLSILNFIPNSLEEKTPFIIKIKSAVKSGSSTAISAVIQGLVKASIS